MMQYYVDAACLAHHLLQMLFRTIFKAAHIFCPLLVLGASSIAETFLLLLLPVYGTCLRFLHSMHNMNTCLLSCLFYLCLSKETVSSAGTADGPSERRISFHSSDRRSSRRLRKPSGMRTTRLGSGGSEVPSGVRSRVASGGTDLPKVNSGLGSAAWLLYDHIRLRSRRHECESE